MDIDLDFESRSDLDDYFILRLPDKEAASLRRMLRNKPHRIARRVSLMLDEHFKGGVLQLNKKLFEGRMVHLPTVTDVNKSMNGTTMYKTGTISQMFVVEGDRTLAGVKHDNWPHGVARPLKNVRRQRFRKTMRNNEEDNDIQEEITWLLRDDYEALSSYYEVSYERTYDVVDFDEDALFGSMSDSNSDDSSASAAHYDIIEYN